ncbi:MAG TPA: UDP-N-acetylmuramate--L-alanine ligase [Anaerolineales bacterium]
MMKHVHLIGIGGSGLSAIALLLLESGVVVSGSDRQLTPLAERLQAAGARVFTGHSPEHVQGADLVVRSSAIPEENVEVRAAIAAGIPVLKRADFLGELMRGRQCIAVAGTHGKTTTTAMIAWMLSTLGKDPSYIIGGVSANLGKNAHAGQGPYFVIEADEYDHMFLGLQPQVAVVTNVEYDHPDCYPTPQAYQQAFLDFAARLAPDGLLLACADDAGAARLLRDAAALGKRALAYGIAEGQAETGSCDYRALSLLSNEAGGFSFDFITHFRPRDPDLGSSAVPLHVALQVPGVHNVRNSLAALAVASLLGLPMGQAGRALGEFLGSGRRFELRGEASGVTVIDDYAHHPTEIRATLAAARARFPGRTIWAVWQPHTYSRTRALFGDFSAAFHEADRVVVTEVYAAREAAPSDGFSASRVAAAIAGPQVTFIPGLADVEAFILANLHPGDVLLVLSAGDADQVSAQVLRGLQEKAGGRRER